MMPIFRRILYDLSFIIGKSQIKLFFMFISFPLVASIRVGFSRSNGNM